jgi:hypothetical protein
MIGRREEECKDPEAVDLAGCKVVFSLSLSSNL